MSIHRLSPVSFLVTLVVTAAISHPAQGETLLRWKFKQGQKSQLAMVMSQEMQIKMAGQNPSNVTSKSTMDFSWEVTSVDSQGVATLTQTTDRIQMKIQTPQGVMMEYDTKAEEKPKGMAAMMASALGGMVGRSYITKMDFQGNILEMNIPQGLAESMGKLPGGAQFGNMFSKEGMKGMAEIATLPKESVNPGDTWTRKAIMKNPMIGDMSIETTFRYIGPEIRDGREVQKIAMEMKMHMGEGGTMKVELSDQTSEGTIYFDNELGQFVEGESKSSMKIKMSVLGQKMEQEMKSNVKTKYVPQEELEK